MPNDYKDPYAAERGGPNELTKQYPRLSGFLQSFLGTAPDEMGSVLDPLTAPRREGARLGFPAGTLAQVAPVLRGLGQMTRTGRNVERAIRGTKPSLAAIQELARVPSGLERSVAVSKRGVAGPVRVGTVGAVQPGRSSRLAPAVEDFHTHSATPDFFGMHPGDVKESLRGKTTILHTSPEGEMLGRSESLVDPQEHLSRMADWSYADPQDYRKWLELRGKYTSDVPEDLYNREAWGDLMDSEGFMATPMDATYKALKKLQPDDLELAMSRAERLPEHIDPSRYSPATLARISALEPAARRGFSESLISTRSPFGASLMRPSEFLEAADPLSAARDAGVIEKLRPLLEKQGMKELPTLWMNQFPESVQAAYEGRHRMKALQDLYGDDPVLMSLIQGDRLEPAVNSMGHPYDKFIEELNLPPLELLKQRIMMGDKQLNINPLWTK